MKEAADMPRALSLEQRRLVEENIGLVRLHLRRNVRTLPGPQNRREYADLFQEGCLGLIEAAGAYDPERGIPFASFAITRIHKAVSNALQRKFNLVHVPPARRGLRGQVGSAGASDTEPVDEPEGWRRDESRRTSPERQDTGGGMECASPPRVLPLVGALARGLCARPQPEAERQCVETIGQRLLSKYERAVHTAGEAVGGNHTRRGDRLDLIRILVEERFLIPDEESRRPLRRIARDTKSSFARVAQCGQRLGEAIRNVLNADPEFQELRRRARTDPEGSAAAIDGTIERRLTEAGAAELIRRYRRAEKGADARLLHSIMQASQTDIERTIRDRFAACPSATRQTMLEESAKLAGAPDRADPDERPRRRRSRAARQERLSDPSRVRI